MFKKFAILTSILVGTAFQGISMDELPKEISISVATARECIQNLNDFADTYKNKHSQTLFDSDKERTIREQIFEIDMPLLKAEGKISENSTPLQKLKFFEEYNKEAIRQLLNLDHSFYEPDVKSKINSIKKERTEFRDQKQEQAERALQFSNVLSAYEAPEASERVFNGCQSLLSVLKCIKSIDETKAKTVINVLIRANQPVLRYYLWDQHRILLNLEILK